jgi:hypothetical protein
MSAYLVAPSAAESNALLNDLLESSERLYHRHVTNIQKAIYSQWLHTVRDQVSREPAVFPEETPAQIEARVCERLAMFRKELRGRQAALIAEQREQLVGRNRGIHAYVASLRA